MEQSLLNIARNSYREPREAAVGLLSLGIPREAIWPAFAVIVLLSVVLSGVGELAAPSNEQVQVSYFAMVGLIAVIFLAFAAGIWKVGQFFGGTGSFEEAMVISIFLQAVLLPFQLVQLFLVLTLPGLAGVYAIGLLFYGIWLNVNFIDALHGFASFGRSLGVMILASLVAALALLIAVAVLGLGMTGMF